VSKIVIEMRIHVFYLIIAVLIISYYVFMAPKSVRNTLSMIAIVALVALLIVLAIMSVSKIMETPPEIFLALAMIVLGFFSIRDMIRMPKK